jgi:ankyrin repeat protein
MSQTPLTPEQTEQVVLASLDLARQGRTADLVDLLDHGLPVEVADHEGNTLLMLASYHGHLDTVTALVEHGADVNRRNHRNQAIIAGALFKGEDDIVHALVEAGADLDAGSPTAREVAALFGQQHLLPAAEG